ncbi:MAG: phenylacetate degradation, enoyl-CoA hydratase paaB [Gemmatimonadetes bacterium]|nr:phenylacetate degradation, enoyl-CoA hydratase paaB [Gemmatimonadota bacterium]
MAYQHLTYELRDGVATITLSRPDVLNSFNAAMAAELLEALAECKRSDDVRAVLLTGAGRAFCAGQDLGSVPLPPAGQSIDFIQIVRTTWNPIVTAIRTLEKPVVGAVNGVAAGAGANLAFACDILIAAEEATFIQSFIRIGLIPDTGGTFFLPRLVGMQRAAALSMLGDKLTSAQALQWGLVWQVVPSSVLQDTAHSLAAQLARMPTRGIGIIKRTLNASFENDLATQLDLEAVLQQEAGETSDHREGLSAFLQKRKPAFTGK